MRLHFHPLSSCSRRAVMTVLELDLSERVERVLVDLPTGAQRAPAHLALNPNGRVPVLEDGDFVLWESHAIMQYLADGTPGQTLLPSDRQGRADVTRWMFWNSHHFAPAVSILNFERMVKAIVGAGEPDPVEVARGERLLTQFAGVLDEHLARSAWIAQGRLTLADLSISAELATMERSKLPLAGFANIQRWFGQIQNLPVWKQTRPDSQHV